jgi:predicted PurR-regulated permease PerM
VIKWKQPFGNDRAKNDEPRCDQMMTLLTERRSLGWLSIAAVAAILWLARPFVSALLLGTLMAFTLEPLYLLFARRSGRAFLASLTTVLLSAALVVAALSIFVSLFVTRAVQFSTALRDQLRAGGQLGTWVQAVSGWLGHLGISSASLTPRLEAGAGQIATGLAGMAGTLASGAFDALLKLLFAMLAMHLILQNWTRIVSALIGIAPLPARYTRELLSEFRRVGRMTILGTVLTGLVQGLLASIGYWISDVPEPLFFGIATALASLIPAVGTLLIWVPAGLYLFANGQPARAIVELVWGTLIVVGFSDYVIRPRLVGDSAMPALLVFVGLFGGLEAFGLSGLILGPVLMGVAVAVLRLYAREKQSQDPPQ